MSVAAAGPFRVKSLSDAVDDETLGVPVDATACTQIVVVGESKGTTSGGVITIEEASFDLLKEPPPATWSSVTTFNAADADGGVQKVVHLTAAQYHWVRARVSDAITGGGSITVYIQGS